MATGTPTSARPLGRSPRPGRPHPRAAGENFPVALQVLPARLRRDLGALYGFARSVDDIGDEGTAPPAQRLVQLDEVDADLARLFTGDTPRLGFVAGLGPTVAAHRLDPQPFADLVEANRRDQLVDRYATWTELLGYCRLSADPVGRLVLGVVGAGGPDLTASSDRVCTALQILEHLQDVGEDAHRGRVYLPREDLDRFGVGEQELSGVSCGRGLRALVGFEAARARELMLAGADLVGRLAGPARVAVAGFVAGGLATLDALLAAGFEVLAEPVRPGRVHTAALGARLLVRGTAR